MVIATHILIDEKGNTIGAEFNINGQLKRYSTTQLKSISEKVDNAIIDKNGFVRAKKGELPKLRVNTHPTTIENNDILQVKELLNKQILNIFHGNKDKDIKPCFGKGKINNDYGQGFYTTPDLELAKEWAWASYTQGDKAYVHMFEIDIQDLNILNLTEMDSLHWIAELFSNRTLTNIEEKEALIDTLNSFVKKYKINTNNYDIIIGYRADDSYFRYATDFLESAIYKDTLENALRYGNLGIQVFIKSQKAFGRLRKIGIEEVPSEYRKKYMNRERDANQRYMDIKRNLVSRKKETIHHFITGD